MTYLSEIKKKDERVPDKPVVAEEEEEGDGVVFDQNPVKVVCPHCGLSIITFIEHESSWVTYLTALVLLMVLGWAAICVVPVVFPLFKDVVHHCPRCLSVLATRSRVSIPNFRQDVMSFRFGSCVVVLARKYVLMLAVLVSIIGGVHLMRTSGAPPAGIDAIQRTEVTSASWEDFTQDCGFKSYLGNPIHVTMAFNEKYKNRTFHWEGSVHRVEEGFNLFGWSQRGAVIVRMKPAQFPSKDLPDLALVYSEREKVRDNVRKLKRGDSFGFVATMVEVGKRGAPHVMALWEVHPASRGASPKPDDRSPDRGRNETEEGRNAAPDP